MMLKTLTLNCALGVSASPHVIQNVFIPFAKGGIAHLVLPEWLHECCQPVGDSSEYRSQTHTCSQVYPRTVKKIQNWWKRDREIWYLAVFNLRFVSASLS